MLLHAIYEALMKYETASLVTKFTNAFILPFVILWISKQKPHTNLWTKNLGSFYCCWLTLWLSRDQSLLQCMCGIGCGVIDVWKLGDGFIHTHKLAFVWHHCLFTEDKYPETEQFLEIFSDFCIVVILNVVLVK